MIRIIHIWCKKDRFQLLINNFEYYDFSSKETVPLEELSEPGFDRNNLNKFFVTDFSKIHIDSIIESLNLFLESYLIPEYDLLLANNGSDSIKCKIITENDSLIQYTKLNLPDTSLYSIKKNNVFKILRNYNHLKFEDFPDNVPIKTSGKEIQKIKLGSSFEIDFSFSKRTSPLSQEVGDSLKNYVEGLRNGYGFACDYNYYFKKNFGTGLNIIYMFSSNSTTYQYSIYNTGKLSENIETIILAPSISYRSISSNEKSVFYAKGFVGYFNYTDIENKLIGIKAKTYCTGISAGFDRFLGNNFIVGCSLSYISGSIGKIKIYGKIIKLNERESLDRFEINLGIRFYMN